MILSDIVRKLLASRGVADSEMEDFLNPSLVGLACPEELPGIVDAAKVILDSVGSHRKVVIFGDYDCDGVCATAIVSKTLGALGGEVTEFIPDRRSEGYGMNAKSVERMLRENPDVHLVVTVDNGINSVAEVASLMARGVHVVVTDHHLPGDEIPAADALVDPKVSAPKRLSDLCGAGVAFLLANQLVSDAKRRGMYSGGSIGAPLIVLAGMATVTDLMPLLGQNRILVAEALRRFAVSAPMGLKELHSRAARNGYSGLTSRDFGFMLGPRINAAGRIASGMEALELVMSDDREITRELARIIDGYNLERKSIEQRMTDAAMEQIVEGAAAQVIHLPDGNPGVAGIVASRVMERLGGVTPVCVIAAGHGSARSPEGLNIRDAFVACSDLLESFGGHAAAGGFVVKDGKIDEFRNRLAEYCLGCNDRLNGRCKERVDLWLDADDVTIGLADELQMLEPYGEGNPEPVFGLKGVHLADVRPMGQDGRHLSFVLRKSGLRGVWWQRGDLVEKLRAASASELDMMFTLAVSEYGERHVELRLVEIEGL